MARDFWIKQATDKPAFPDLLWSKPENRQQAGKLLIIGGNLYGFAAPAEAYQESVKAGIGTARVLLPDAIKTHFFRFQGSTLKIEYAPGTPSGSFGQKALAEFLAISNWADGVLVAGDLGRNSETAIVLEKFADIYVGQLTITKDAADYFTAAPQKILGRPETLFVISFAQLQKLAAQAKFPRAFTFGMDFLHIIDVLHEFTTTHPTANITVKHLDNVFVASAGRVSSTKLTEEQEVWRVRTSAHAAVWWLQNSGKPFEALTTAISETAT